MEGALENPIHWVPTVQSRRAVIPSAESLRQTDRAGYKLS
ncbi:hypothetical protein Cst_c19040 [Thermoclostridium stercorarium subsp. stercorarium DSM 8532]|uniref:Uncharacterized protein n=1 Tax=Thermoclostridium stercorarium (strain ATCC 35414 / DSM 8532 / NCIMB 11754) TaxID=1121335 RepID=L7VR49_THES1|nr:hypothetical protein Cst_c19040 [Thermoclostridium stercorarium subsp. stercorarium DSM 8532]